MAKLLYVVGLGPGDPALLTGQAKSALDDAQLLCGYKVYIDLVAPLCPGKPTLTTPMTQEVERCRLALEAADGLVEALRVVKDNDEIEALRASFRLNHAMLDWVRDKLVPGRSEQEVSWDIERYFREHGASELAFANIVAVGPNAALPHAVPGGDRIGENCPVLLDIGCRVQDYCSDQTRTFWVGDAPTDEFRRTLEQVQAAQKAALAVLRPGLPMCDAYAAARRVFEKAGVEKYFTHGLGHGVGLETHEAPSLNPRRSDPLRAGMVVTVEPGLYYPQWGGVRWEHTALITEDGATLF